MPGLYCCKQYLFASTYKQRSETLSGCFVTVKLTFPEYVDLYHTKF